MDGHFVKRSTKYKRRNVYRGRPKTVKDWDRQEAEERNVKKPEDIVSRLVGCVLHWRQYTHTSWRYHPNGAPVTVSRFYPHERLIIDEPPTEEETEKRIELFNRLGVKYFYIEVGEALDEEQFLERLKQVRGGHEKVID